MLELGTVVWRDLFTTDVDTAKQFYSELFGWSYRIEHADQFVWTGEPADYPLIIANDSIQGGIVDSGGSVAPQWVSYFYVADVDAAFKLALRKGATAECTPFDTTGVGRSALLRDGDGAMFGIFTPLFDYPAPKGVFAQDALLLPDAAKVPTLYEALFDWKLDGACARTKNGTIVATVRKDVEVSPSHWVPVIKVEDVDHRAAELERLGGARRQGKHMFADPCGAELSLIAATAQSVA